MIARHSIANQCSVAFGCTFVFIAGACSHELELDSIRTSKLNAQGGTNGVNSTTALDVAGAAGVAGVDPTGGGVPLASSLPELLVTLSDFVHYDEHDRSLAPKLVQISDQSFTLAWQFPYGSGSGEPGSAGFYAATHKSVGKADALRAFFWARCVVPDPTSGTCQTALVFEDVAEPYKNRGLEYATRVGTSWSLYEQAFTAMDTLEAGSAQLTFRLGYPSQMLELGAVGLENFGLDFGLERLNAFDNAASTELVATTGSATYGNVSQQMLSGIEYPFGFAMRLSTLGQTFSTPHESGLQSRTVLAIQTGDALMATFWARCVEDSGSASGCRTAAVFEETNAPYNELGLSTDTIRVMPTWQQFFFPFRALKDCLEGGAKLGLRLGYPDQVIDVGPVSLRRLPTTFPLDTLPRTPTQ